MVYFIFYKVNPTILTENHLDIIKKTRLLPQEEYIDKKINNNLVIQNTHKLSITFKQKKEPYFKTLFLIVLYKAQNWPLFFRPIPVL